MEIFGVGLPELLLIAVVALIVLGPDRLPEAARTLGKGVADLRKAIEPARSAWTDLANEMTSATSVVRSAAGTATGPRTSAPAALAGGSLKSPSGEKTTAIPIGNPWRVHPIMQDMTEEERKSFMAGGQVPARILESLSSVETGNGRVKGAFPDPIDIDYPMPHSTIPFIPAVPADQPMEELDYPSPTNYRNRSTQPTQED